MKVLLQIFLLFIGAVLGICGTLVVDWYQNRTKFLEYSVYSSNALLTPIYYVTQETDSVTLTINNRRLSNISQFDVFVVNASNKDLSDVEIYIDLHSDKELRIIAPNFFDHNGSKEGIEPIPGLQSIHRNGTRFGYRVRTLNRREDFRGACVFKFLLEGDIVPNVAVQTNKPGVEIREAKPVENRSWPDLSVRDALVMLGILFLFTNGAAILLNLYERRFMRKAMQARSKA